MGSGSGACGVVRGIAPFLCDDPVYQEAADTHSSRCIGVGGDVQVRARAGASALASALAAMRKDAACGQSESGRGGAAGSGEHEQILTRW